MWPKLKPTPQTKAPGQANRPPSRKDSWISALSMQCVGVIASQELPLHMLQSHGTQNIASRPPESGDQGVAPGQQVQKLG